MKLDVIPFGPIMPPPDLILALRNPQYFLVAGGILFALIAAWLLLVPRNRRSCVARLGGLRWLESRTPDALAPTVQKLAGPGGREVTPNMFKGRHPPVSAEGGQARRFQLAHAPAFFRGPVLTILEQGPAQLLQTRLQSGLRLAEPTV